MAKNLLRKVVTLFVFFGLNSVFAQQKGIKNDIKDIDAILIEGKNSIGVHAPEGWRLDKDAASGMGICVIYTKSGSDFHTSPAIMYPRFSEAGISGAKGIEKLAQEMAKIYKDKSPKFKLEKKPEYKSAKGLKFTIQQFLNGPSPNEYETAAYFESIDRVFFVILSARNEKDFKSQESSFYKLLDKVIPYSTDMSPLSGNCLYPDSKK